MTRERINIKYIVKKKGCFSQNEENDQIPKSAFFIKQENVFKTIVLFFLKYKIMKM